MKLNPIVLSLADTDSYKLSMLQAALHRAPGVQVTLRFKCRNKDVNLCPYADEIQAQINNLATLRFTEEELLFFSQRRYFKPDLIDFLRTFQFYPKHINISTKDNVFDLRISGTWAYVMLYEIFILSIISEVYFRTNIPSDQFDKYYDLAEQELRKQLKKVKAYVTENPQADPFNLIEFGTRRRFTRQWQEKVVKILLEEVPAQFFGTSNEDLARRFKVRASGTMAHEFLQAHQALEGITLVHSQRAALETWVQEYRGDLGIALTDVINMDAFLNDFDLFYAKLFDGLRHDSGDPYVWGDKAIAHYKKLGINPKTKVLVFSDSWILIRQLLYISILMDA